MDLRRIVSNITYNIEQDDLIRKCIAKTKFFVEGKSYPLFEKYAKQSDFSCDHKRGAYNIPKLNWSNSLTGLFLKVGEFGGMPVCFTIDWRLIDGIYVAFWEHTSLVVHYEMIEDKLNEMFPNAEKSDYVNFGNVIMEIIEMNKQIGKEIA